MGGSRPSPPSIVMPAPTAPTLYQSTTPLESYEDLAGQLKRIQQETGKIQEQRYQEVGTPSELGALAKGRRVQETASYLAGLPSGDKYLRQTTGQADKYAPAKEAAQENLTEAQKAYAEALKKAAKSQLQPFPKRLLGLSVLLPDMGSTFNKNLRLAGQNFKQPESVTTQPETIRTPTSYLISRNRETGEIEKTPRTWKEEPAPVVPKPEMKPNPFEMIDIGNGRKMPAFRVNPWSYVNKS